MTNVEYLYNNEVETSEKLMMKRRDNKNIVEVVFDDNHVGDASYTRNLISKTRKLNSSKIFKTKFIQT